jgi:hypothetical protein
VKPASPLRTFDRCGGPCTLQALLVGYLSSSGRLVDFQKEGIRRAGRTPGILGGVPDLSRPGRAHVAPFGDSPSGLSIPGRGDRVCQDTLKGSIRLKPACDVPLEPRQGLGVPAARMSSKHSFPTASVTAL